ncbi:MAG TPA: hypothetical protein VFY36_05130 [Solirubrobacteraceae bacterium]|nr:hypothetical protein [Solirubrobacteraceae bacterium]
MRFPRRAPREVYRLYSEDEFLAGATWEPDVEEAGTARVPTDLRRRRVLSAAILLGAASAVGALIALNSFVQSKENDRPGGRARVAKAKPRIAVGLHKVVVAQARQRARAHRRARSSRHSSQSLRRQPHRHPNSYRFASASVASTSAGTRPAEFGFER